jgi:quinol monooxygenase YgiN
LRQTLLHQPYRTLNHQYLIHMQDSSSKDERIVIVAYKPKPGKKEALVQLMKEHVPILRSQNLVTDRQPFIMEAKDGTVIEVFEWKSMQAIGEAHSNLVVLKMWERFNDACEYIPLGKVEEATVLFAGFQPINLD